MRAIGLIFVLIAVLWGCGDQSGNVVLGDQMEHETGLRAAAPEGFTVKTLPDGFRFDEAGRPRYARRIELRMAEHAPELEAPKRRTLAGMPVDFRIDTLAGGSGGTEYRLTAVRPDGDQFLILTAYDQSERGTPDFADAWAVLESADRR
jgi:hypothetical protein